MLESRWVNSMNTWGVHPGESPGKLMSFLLVGFWHLGCQVGGPWHHRSVSLYRSIWEILYFPSSSVSDKFLVLVPSIMINLWRVNLCIPKNISCIILATRMMWNKWFVCDSTWRLHPSFFPKMESKDTCKMESSGASHSLKKKNQTIFKWYGVM